MKNIPMNRQLVLFLLIGFLLIGVAPSVMAQDAGADSTQTEQVEKEAPKSFFEKIFPFLFKNKDKDKKQAEEGDQAQKEVPDKFDKLSQDELNYYFLRAVKLDRHDLMVRLLEEGALINARDTHGRTALIEAARTGKYRMCKTLIEYGASVNADDRYDGTALDYASRGGYVDIVNLLLKNGAKQ
jgi:ankyrin repeat protein